jgi:hypothetical protein
MANSSFGAFLTPIIREKFGNVTTFFKNHKTILSKDRQTGLDIWVSYIAFIFGLEFKGSYELINKKDYLNKLFNRFEYKADKSTMEELKKCAFDYLNNKLNQ